MGLKDKLIAAFIAFIIAIVVLALFDKLQVVKTAIDSMTALVAGITALVTVLVHGYLDKK